MALCFSPSVALADTKTYSSSGTASVASADTAKKQKIDVNNLTLTNDLIVDFADSTAVVANSKTGVTIINNGTIMNTDDGLRDYAVKAQSGTDFTLTNSGTIAAADSYAVDINQSSGSTITNNAGGIIKAKRWAVNGTDATTSNATVTNSGKIYITSSNAAIQFTSATGTTITNNPGGEIYRDSSASGNNPAVKIGVSSSLTNSGQIRDDGVDDRAIMVTGNNTTVTNNIGGLIGGEFKIDNIPPGDYILNAWHYLMKPKSQKIHVTKNGTVDVKFEFDANKVVRPLYETIKSGRIKKDAVYPGTAKGRELGR